MAIILAHRGRPTRWTPPWRQLKVLGSHRSGCRRWSTAPRRWTGGDSSRRAAEVGLTAGSTTGSTCWRAWKPAGNSGLAATAWSTSMSAATTRSRPAMGCDWWTGPSAVTVPAGLTGPCSLRMSLLPGSRTAWSWLSAACVAFLLKPCVSSSSLRVCGAATRRCPIILACRLIVLGSGIAQRTCVPSWTPSWELQLPAPTPVPVEVVTVVRPRLTEHACEVRSRLLRSDLPLAPLLF